MSTNEDILEKIERFTRGEMSAEESMRFEKQINADKELQKQVGISKIVDQMVVGNEFSKLRIQMNKDLNKTKPYNGAVIFSVIILMCIGLFFLIAPKNDQKNKVTDEVNNKKESIKVIAEEIKDTSVKTELRNENHVNSKPEKVHKKKSETDNIKKPGLKHDLKARFQEPAIPDSSDVDSPLVVYENKSGLVFIDSIKDPCDNFKPNIDFYTTPSCSGEETGEVIISQREIKGGIAPFTFYLGDRVSLSGFNKVPAGSYDLKIVDGADCEVIISGDVQIKEITCRKNLQYSFNPNYDNVWNIPFDEKKSAIVFKVLDKRGKLYYQASITSNQPSTWSGESNFGLQPEVGLYFFTIEYADNTIDEGTILISR